MRGNKERETRKRLDKAWTWIPAQVHAGMTGGGVDLVSRSSACGNDGGAWHTGTTERGEMTVMGIPVTVGFTASHDRLTIADYLTILDDPLTGFYNRFTTASQLFHGDKIAASPYIIHVHMYYI